MPNAMRPLLSLVVACYRVAEYLPEFIASLDGQLTPDVEVLLVIDGSPDDSARLAHAWERRSKHRVTVIEQEHQGVASARNAGLRAAAGHWVSFPDPDDVLDRGYLSRVTDFLRSPAASRASLVSTNLVPFAGMRHAIVDDHPLRWKYREGRRLVVLDDHPDVIQLATNSAFLRRDVLVAHGIEFDSRVRPVGEDAHLIARYLLSVDAPASMLLPDARYLYRRRADNSSLMGSVWTKPEKYDDVLRHLHVSLLEATGDRGVPRWLENTVIYDLSWYFQLDARVNTPTAALTPKQRATLLELLRQVFSHVSTDAITEYRVTALPDETREAMLALTGRAPSPRCMRVATVDTEQMLTAIVWNEHDGATIAPRFTVGNRAATPSFFKRRRVTYFGTGLFDEVTAWVPGTGEIAASVEGAPIEVTQHTRPRALTGLTEGGGPFSVRGVAALVRSPRSMLTILRQQRSAVLQAAVRIDTATQTTNDDGGLARRVLAPGGRRFHGCWLFVDRDTEAHDNAEHLYRYVRDHHPEINAWFVLGRGSADWSRLEADGFRLIAHGSPTHALALTQCRELISSQIDHYIVSPTCVLWMRRRPWRFTWLQHGVIQSDLSRWLNTKSPSTVVTTTPAEFASMAGDGTPYRWGRHEVVLTGQARHDALLAKAAAVPLYERDSVVFMPTWRRGLLGDGVQGGNSRVAAAGFWHSDYASNWLGLIGSETVREAATRAGLRLVLLPHPNMVPFLTPERLPPHVTVATYADNDVQDVLAAAACVVTDYSSNAFEAAMIDRPVVYFQFDREEFLAGTHIGRPGYFDYERDGFGPVTVNLADAEASLAAMIASGPTPGEPYANRIRETFTMRDVGACERIIAQIRGARSPESVLVRATSHK